MADIAEITQKDREKIKQYVENSNFLNIYDACEQIQYRQKLLIFNLKWQKNFCGSK